MTNLFHIIGYVGEVSVPNEPAVRGFFLDRWGKEANKDFAEWLALHDEEVRRTVLDIPVEEG